MVLVHYSYQGAMQVQNSTLHQQHLHAMVTQQKGHNSSLPLRHQQTCSKAQLLLQKQFQNYEKSPTYKQKSLVTIFRLNISKHFSTKYSQAHIVWTTLKSCLGVAVLNSLLILSCLPPSRELMEGRQLAGPWHRGAPRLPALHAPIPSTSRQKKANDSQGWALVSTAGMIIQGEQ